MADFHKMTEEESLKRSHSKFSNFKLTLVCLLCAISTAFLMASLATVDTGILSNTAVVAAVAVSAFLTAASLFLISRFKR